MRLMSSDSALPAEILTVKETADADRSVIRSGTPGIVLMENAGRAVADAVDARCPSGTVAVLAGPGNNGGDGFVAARHLARRGRDVRLALFGAREALTGDAATAAARWAGEIHPFDRALIDGAATVVDAVFGAGLSRPLPAGVTSMFDAARARELPCIAVDLPSGVDGDTGSAAAGALPARATVTFHRLKPAHVLFPGRALAGEIVLADIGIPKTAEARWAYGEWIGIARRRFGDRADAAVYSPGTGRAAVLAPHPGGALEALAIMGMRWEPGKLVSRRSLRGLRPLAKGGS